MNRPTISVVIPAYGRWPMTRSCLQSLTSRVRATDEVIVVDNGSTDETPRALRGFKRVIVVRHDENLGFAKGCNSGAAVATGDVLVLLNNDCAALDHWAEHLVAPFDEPDVGITGAMLFYPRAGRPIQHAGMAIPEKTRWPSHIHKNMTLQNDPGAARPKDLQCVTGACLAIRRELWRDLGGLDEGYVNSFEDVDLCFRARLQHGVRVRFAPDAQLFHHEGQTEGRFDHDRQNAERFFSKFPPETIEVDADRILIEDAAWAIKQGWAAA